MWQRPLLGLLLYLGVCEVLATTQSIDWGRVPDALAMAVVPVGFFGIILLAGFVGQVLLATVLFLVTWRRFGWPAW